MAVGARAAAAPPPSSSRLWRSPEVSCEFAGRSWDRGKDSLETRRHSSEEKKTPGRGKKERKKKKDVH